jgi:hypothetical protein
VEEVGVESFAASVRRQYLAVTRKQAQVYPVAAATGAGLIN